MSIIHPIGVVILTIVMLVDLLVASRSCREKQIEDTILYCTLSLICFMALMHIS